MSRQITQPITQVRLTNVAVVRMNLHGKRFEVACYRNKVVNYRQGLETDLSEVLQTDRIFTNVSKGKFASRADLQQCFGADMKEDEIVEMILKKGVLQVSDLERSQQYENVTREVAATICSQCVNPKTNRPYTLPQIRSAMQAANFTVHPQKRSVKKQFLDCVKLLQQKNILPLERAKMELCLVLVLERNDNDNDNGNGNNDEKTEAERVEQLQNQVSASLTKLKLTVTKSAVERGRIRITFLADPSLYRQLDSLAKDHNGRLEIIRQAVMEETDVNLDADFLESNLKEEPVAEAPSQALIQKEDEHKESSASSSCSLVTELMHDISLKETPQQVADIVDPTNQSKDEDDEGDIIHSAGEQQTPTTNARKNQKKAQKKSKKAKRREKEDREERAARLEAERIRRSERGEILTADTGTGTTTTRVTTTNTVAATNNSLTTDAVARSCNTCGGSFATAASYRAHFRSDWHRYNIKLKMKGLDAVSEEEFQVCDADAFFDVTS